VQSADQGFSIQQGNAAAVAGKDSDASGDNDIEAEGDESENEAIVDCS
jgi:hypothetical protein